MYIWPEVITLYTAYTLIFIRIFLKEHEAEFCPNLRTF